MSTLCEKFVCVLHHKHALHVLSFPLFVVPLNVVTWTTPCLVPLYFRANTICFCFTFVSQVAHVRPKYPMSKYGLVWYFVTSRHSSNPVCWDHPWREIAHIYMGNVPWRLVLAVRPGIWSKPALQFVSVPVDWSDVEVNSPKHTHGHV